MKVAYQGTLGSYGHQASMKHFKEKVNPVGYTLSEQVVEALISKQVDYAILPVENSIIGNIDINMDLIYKNEIKAIDECYIPIKHCLLGKPGTSLKDIKTVYSHPAALGQCRDFWSKITFNRLATLIPQVLVKRLKKMRMGLLLRSPRPFLRTSMMSL